MINGIGVENFRSFKNKTQIELKPITIFVGKNSSGKSSFLRTFPLFRQSVEENTTGPVLWYGRYVDFGDFDEIKSKDSDSDLIGFNFNITLSKDSRFRRYHPRYSVSSIDDIVVNVSLSVYSKGGKTKTREVMLEFNDSTVTITLDDNDNAKLIIKSNGYSVTKEGLIARNLGRFIPVLMQKKVKEEVITTGSKRSYFGIGVERGLESSFLESATKLLQPHFHSKTDVSNISYALARINFTSYSEFSDMLESMFKEQRTFVRNYTLNKDEIAGSIYPYILGYNVNDISEMVNGALIDVFRSVKYIAPLRATSERFYRFQDLQVDEIDFTGSNLAMVLNSLKPQEKVNFEKWTKDNFDFVAKVKQVGAHFAVNISTADEKNEFNIRDMGFGYSQVLPIVTAIWLETERGNNYRRLPITFLIEQPELHLHPSYQYSLAETFARVVSKAKEREIDLKIIFETHSQSMIEALGECIERDDVNISADDISILVFDKSDEKHTAVTSSYFNEDGYLTNWPIGFFSGR